MAKGYYGCAAIYAHRRNKKLFDWKPVSHNQWLRYNEREDCYEHKHHSTITVRIYKDKYAVNTGGWNTTTTWKKIHEYACIHVCGKPSPLFVGDKFVYWDGRGEGRAYTEFYDGIEVGLDGVPLDPQPVEVRRATPGVRAEFYAMVKKVRAAVAVRVLVGEFDEVQHTPPDDHETLQLMQMVAAKSEGLFVEYVPHEEIAPLFAQREVLAFGRPRRNFFGVDPTTTSAKSRLNSSINAAKRAWDAEYSTDDLYETIKRSYT